MGSKYDDLGFVPIEEIQNVFTIALTELEDEVMPEGTGIEKRHVLEFFDGLKYKLVNRSKYNLQEYLQQNPIVKAEVRKEKADEQSKKNRETWENRVANNRRAMRSE